MAGRSLPFTPHYTENTGINRPTQQLIDNGTYYQGTGVSPYAFPGDPRNIAGQSDPLTVTVQQDQNPSFTISGSAAVLTEGQTETMSRTPISPSSATIAAGSGHSAGSNFQSPRCVQWK